MKILVAVTDYSKPNKKDTHYFVQVRNLYYQKVGIDVSVLNFSAKEDYVVNGIQVYSLNSYIKHLRSENFNLLVCHAPNIRNHYIFLKKYENDFKRIVFFFHGHEVLDTGKVYSKPYDYVKDSSFISKLSRSAYDRLKLYLWKHYFMSLSYKSYFIFVSNWMKEEFYKWTKISDEYLSHRAFICYNSIGEVFEKEKYNVKGEKIYDFITIRSNIDGSKYAIDIVNNLAFSNPKFKFLVVGKGDYFSYNEKAPNLIWKDELLNHCEIIECLNKSRCALMPTRTDAQGLMMCEMASFGVPVITSDIPVCLEVFFGFNNVRFINNEKQNTNLEVLLNELCSIDLNDINKKYYSINTVAKEVKLFEKFV